MPISPLQVDIVEAIRKDFDQLAAANRFAFPNPGGSTFTAWTTAIKTALCSTGQKKFKFAVGCSKVAEANYGEFLYDITWCETNEADQIVDMPLVAESELSNKTVAGIVEDFQKLLVARAGVRLMIHEVWFDREEISTPGAMANHLAQHVQAYCHTRCDDVYLLVVLTWEGYRNRVLRYFRLGADGRATEWVQDGPCPFVANAP